MKKDAGHEFNARIDVRVEKDQMATGQEAEDRTTRGSLAVEFRSPEAAVRGGVSAASESVCASIAVMQGESRQMDGSMTMRHDADRSS